MKFLMTRHGGTMGNIGLLSGTALRTRPYSWNRQGGQDLVIAAGGRVQSPGESDAKHVGGFAPGTSGLNGAVMAVCHKSQSCLSLFNVHNQIICGFDPRHRQRAAR